MSLWGLMEISFPSKTFSSWQLLQHVSVARTEETSALLLPVILFFFKGKKTAGAQRHRK
jgi:hypothetical protein